MKRQDIIIPMSEGVPIKEKNTLATQQDKSLNEVSFEYIQVNIYG